MTLQFYEDFEDNDWTANWDTTQPDGSGLNITTDAAFAGTYGGEGSTTVDDVADTAIDFATAAGVAHFGFRFNQNDAAANNNDREDAFLYTGGTSFTNQVNCQFRRDTGGDYILRFEFRNDSAGNEQIDSGALSAGWHNVEIILTRESSDGAADGDAEVFIDSVSIGSVGGYDNFNNYAGIESLTLQSFSFSGGGSGTFYVDDITVYDDDTPIFGVDSSHIWLSTDGGDTFTDIGDSITWGSTPVSAVAVAYGTSGQTIWAMVGANLYRTTDGGSAWASIATPSFGSDMLETLDGAGTLYIINNTTGGNRAATIVDATAAITYLNTGKTTDGSGTSGGVS